MHAHLSRSGLILLFTVSIASGAPFRDNNPGEYALVTDGSPTGGQVDLLMNTAAAAEITVPSITQRKPVIKSRGFQWLGDGIRQNNNEEDEQQHPNPFYKREINTGGNGNSTGDDDGNDNDDDDGEPESGSEPSLPSLPENIRQISEAQTYFIIRELVRISRFIDVVVPEALSLNPFISRERATAIASELIADANALGTVSADFDTVLLEVQLLELNDYAERLERGEGETQTQSQLPGEEAEEEESPQPQSETLHGIKQLIDNQTVLLTTELARRGILIEDLLYHSVRDWNPYATEERARLIARVVRSRNIPDDNI